MVTVMMTIKMTAMTMVVMMYLDFLIFKVKEKIVLLINF